MIVDDEPIARDILTSYISRIPALHLVKSCRNATEAYEGLYEHTVDLLFLDIQMPVITGTEFLRSLRKPPMVVFTTAYSQFAVEGFELYAVDYLLKPITFERFYQAVQKAMERTTPPPAAAPPDYLFIKQDGRFLRLNHADIDYIEAEKDFCYVHQGAKKLLVSMHLKLFEAQLPVQQFIRVHRSYMVNVAKIRALQGNIIEINAAEIPVGASYKDGLTKRLGLS